MWTGLSSGPFFCFVCACVSGNYSLHLSSEADSNTIAVNYTLTPVADDRSAGIWAMFEDASYAYDQTKQAHEHRQRALDLEITVCQLQNALVKIQSASSRAHQQATVRVCEALKQDVHTLPGLPEAQRTAVVQLIEAQRIQVNGASSKVTTTDDTNATEPFVAMEFSTSSVALAASGSGGVIAWHRAGSSSHLSSNFRAGILSASSTSHASSSTRSDASNPPPAHELEPDPASPRLTVTDDRPTVSASLPASPPAPQPPAATTLSPVVHAGTVAAVRMVAKGIANHPALESTISSGPLAPMIPPALVLQGSSDGSGMSPALLWELDTLAMTNLQRLRTIVGVFRHFDLLARFHIAPVTLVNFAVAISREYQPNPFHNFVHGFTVFHACAYTLATSTCLQTMPPLEILAMLMAALCHVRSVSDP